MVWNLRDDLPIYSQLVDQVRMAVVSGDLKPGDKIPGVREMAMDAGVNPNTMQRAMNELEREGILYSQRTNGRFVTEDYALLGDIRAGLAKEQTDSYIKSMARLKYTRAEVERLVENALEEEKL